MNILRKIRIPVLIVVLILSGMFISKMAADAYKESLLVTGYQMTVDGKDWGIVADKKALTDMLDVYKSTYVKDVDVKAHFTSIDFAQKIVITDVRVEKEKFTALADVKKLVYAVEKPAVYYTVKKGDSLWNIAIKNKVSLATIIKYNPQLNPDKIWAGNKILFAPMNPVLDVNVKLESTVVESVEYATQYIKDKTLLQNTRVVVKKGVEGSKEVTYSVTMKNGYEETIAIVKETQLKAPVGSIVKVGTKRTLLRVSGSNFGVVTGRLSSNFGWRHDPISGAVKFHSGIDIATRTGTPIYAWGEGTVIEAGFNNTQGYHVIIRHSSSLTTSYLHMSKMLVRVGQHVVTGQRIGLVGSTGYTTGAHLHFTVTRNGSYVSPWDYI
ncbi:MAG: M23 family metallopeptidase [Erysipelotrichaceae bacterium]